VFLIVLCIVNSLIIEGVRVLVLLLPSKLGPRLAGKTKLAPRLD